MRRIPAHALRIALHTGALLPLAWLLWDAWNGQLGANPIREAQLRTGRYTLDILLLSLACTPVYRVLGLRQALELRRPLGLYAFLYASLHFLNFLGVDYGFNLALIRDDLFEKRYAIIGFAAYLILAVPALTSTRGWRERLGKRWKLLHRAVYIAAGLGVVHYLWSAKVDVRTPIIYGLVLAVLLALRLPWARKANSS